MDNKVGDRMEVETKEKARAAVKTGAQPFTGIEAWWRNLDGFVAGLIITGAMAGILLTIAFIWGISGHR